MKRAFICHNSSDSKFVIEVCRYLKQNIEDVYYFEDYQRRSENAASGFINQISNKLIEFEIFIVFISKKLTEWQKNEVNTIIEFQNSIQNSNDKKRIIPILLGIEKIPTEISLLRQYDGMLIKQDVNKNTDAYLLAQQIIKKLGLHWNSKDDLPPISNYFHYEKNIIKDYINLLKFDQKLYDDFLHDDESEKIRLDLREKLIFGLPPIWPKVKRMPTNIDESENLRNEYHDNTVDENIIGKFRPDDAKVISAALTSFHPEHEVCIYRSQLTFPEAGPRKSLYFPRENRNLKVAVIVSGGIAPGINSVINGIVQRHELYAELSQDRYSVEIYGLQNGFYAFDDYFSNRKRLTSTETSKIANESGSFIGTSRDDRLLNISSDQDQNHSIITQLLNDDIEILYIIGGDGSMKAAHALWNYSKEMIKQPPFLNKNKKISIIGIPKTMDNDILWVWQTFGFLSAVEKAREIIEHLSAEVISNPRIGIVQLFGSDSGFVVSHAVVASKSTICDAALIPEVPFTLKKFIAYLKEKIERDKLRKDSRIPMSLIVMAETAIPTDALEYINKPELDLSQDEKDAIRWFMINSPQFNLSDQEKENLRKQIKARQLVSINKRNDNLRTAGLKIVKWGLENILPQRDSPNISWKRLRVFTNEPRHLLRTTSPSCSDTIMGNRLGTLAVDNALAGYTDFMISQWLTEFVMVPLKLVILGKKRIPISGNFWKSVTTKTGQPDLS